MLREHRAWRRWREVTMIPRNVRPGSEAPQPLALQREGGPGMEYRRDTPA
jgi:hypothetical protein